MCLFTELTVGVASGSAALSAVVPVTMLADPFFLLSFQPELLFLLLSDFSVDSDVFFISLSFGHAAGLCPFLAHKSQVLLRHAQASFLWPLRVQRVQLLPLLLWTELAVPEAPFSAVFVAAS